MLFQEELIGRVREKCATDEGLDAALMYGSFAADEAGNTETMGHVVSVEK